MLAPPEIRPATLADVDAYLDLAERLYPGRGVSRSRPWVEWCIDNPERLVLVGPGCFAIAQVTWHYGFERRARLDVLAGSAGFTTFRMIRHMLTWARSMGATGDFLLDADTGVDFEPFARRLGARPKIVRYAIPLEE